MTCCVFEYRGFSLNCTPMELGDGGFGVRIAIKCPNGKTYYEKSFPKLAYFYSPRDAVADAKSIGQGWVDGTLLEG